MAIPIITAILVLMILLLITEWLPVDVTAVGIMVLLMVTEILPPRLAVAGFSHPAVITVGAMFVISKAMIRTGAVEFIGRYVTRLAKGSMTLALGVILLTVGVASAFINNTPVVLLFIPVIMIMCCEFNLSPSKFLIPVSYASILAGTCTLIGTSTNIIVSDLSLAAGYGAIGMFELGRLGVPVAVAGIIFLLIAAPRLMPSLFNPTCQFGEGEQRRYLAELKIPRGSPLVGEDPVAFFAERHPDLGVLELIRHSIIYHPERDPVEMAPDDRLLVKGSVNALVAVLQDGNVVLPSSEQDLSFSVARDAPVVVEMIITPESNLLGRRLVETELIQDPAIHFIAIRRRDLHYTEREIQEIRLRIGDIVLVWCGTAKLIAMRAAREYIIIEDISEEIVLKRKAWLSLLIFGGLIIGATSGLADIMTCALTAAFLMILAGCIQPRDAYQALQRDVLLLIVGTIALGEAMQITGASRVYAEAFLGLFAGYSPRVVLGGLLLLTSVCTQVLSNNATAVLLFPIAISTAASLGADARPFIIAVCFGASACFASPMGYQTNLLVYGPGGYRFSDYLTLGIPLNLLVLAAGAVFIPWFWPF